MKCSGCQAERTGERAGNGWHRLDTGVYCSSCWSERYVLRAAIIPVAGPVGGADWKALREALKPAFRDVARLSNWAVRELAKAEKPRLASDEKLPQPAKTYLYPGARKLAPDLDSGTVIAVLHAVEGRYRRARFDAIWRCAVSLPSYRLDRSVLPCHNQAWKAEMGADGEALVSMRLDGSRWTLRLRGGRQFRRQLGDHRQLACGEAVRGELALYEQSTGGSDHRPGTEGRDDGGQRQRRRLMCKMVGYFPRSERGSGEGALVIQSTPEALLVAGDLRTGRERRLWTYHGDHILRWQAEYASRNKALSDDRKAGLGKRMRSRQQAEATKHRRRIDSACHEMSAHVVGFAKRLHFAKVVWLEDSEGIAPISFPWFKFKTYLASKCDAGGLGYEALKLASGPVAHDAP